MSKDVVSNKGGLPMKTIGDLICALETAKPDVRVYFAFGHVAPTTVDSWRGIYAEAALGFTGGDYGTNGPTVAELLQRLRESIDGREYTGWKGGEYTYNRGTPLHVDNPGNYSSTEMDRIEVSEYGVTIHTVTEP